MNSTADSTPLHEAIELDDANAIQALLASGADARAADSAGRTPLMQAALKARARAVKALLPASHPRARDQRGLTSLMLAIAGAASAVREGRDDALRATLRALAPLSRPSAWNQRGESALLMAAQSPHGALIFEEMAPFCDARDWARLDKLSENLLDAAIANDNVRAARWLLDSGMFHANARESQPRQLRESRFARGALAGLLMAKRYRQFPVSDEMVSLLAQRTHFSRVGGVVFSSSRLLEGARLLRDSFQPSDWACLDRIAAESLEWAFTQSLLAPENAHRARFPRALAAQEAAALRQTVAQSLGDADGADAPAAQKGPARRL